MKAYKMLICLVAFWTVWTFGCVSYDAETGEYWELREQRYEYDKVVDRLPKLQKGMKKLEVVLILGSPARSENDRWIYLPDRPGTIIPGEALVVRFKNGRYEDYKFDVIVFGGRVSKPFE